MKKILLSSFIAAAAAVPAFAGINNLNYQAVIKNGNEVVANEEVYLKFELLDGENVVYTEKQDAKTNASGYVSCQIGTEEELPTTLNWGDLTLKVSVSFGASGYSVVSEGAVSSVPTALYALRSADSDMIKDAVEEIMIDVESNKTSLLGVNAELARIDGFIEDVDAFNTELSEKLEPMMGLNYEEICDFHERVSNQLIVINETLEDMQGTDLHAYIDTLNTLKAELEAKLKDLDGFAAAMEEVNDLKLQVENLNQVSAVVRVNEDAIEELQGDFKNLGENLDKLVEQIEAKNTETDGQLENLNNVAAVVRANEDAIEELQGDFKNLGENLTMSLTEVNTRLDDADGKIESLQTFSTTVKEEYATNEAVEAFSDMLQTNLDKIQKQADTTDSDLENIKENLTNAFAAKDAEIAEINGQLENLNNVAAVVRANEEAIDEIKDTLNQLIQALKDLDVLPNTFNVGK